MVILKSILIALVYDKVKGYLMVIGADRELFGGSCFLNAKSFWYI